MSFISSIFFITALSDTDFDSLSTTRTFSAGDGNTATACANISIEDDVLIEGDQDFAVTLSLVTMDMGVTLGSPITTTVTIRDDDGNQIINQRASIFYHLRIRCQSEPCVQFM